MRIKKKRIERKERMKTKNEKRDNVVYEALWQKYTILKARKTHGCIRRTPISDGQIKKKNLVKQSTNIKHYEINIMNIINNNPFNLHNGLLNNGNR